MSPVHGIAGLESHDPLPAQAGEFSAQFCRSRAERTEVIMCRRLHSFQLAANVKRVALVDEVGNTGVLRISRTEDQLGFTVAIWLPNFFNFQSRQHHAFRIAKRDALS